MVEMVKLKKAVDYSDSRISINDVALENFVTTDNLLPNKLGLTTAVNLPPQEGYMPSFQKDNILVGNIRPYLKKIWFSDRSGGCSADVLVFDVKKEYHPKYVYYAMFRDDFFDHMMRGSKGTKMPRGDKTHILDFTIPKIDPTRQKKIAAVLSSLDAKIELNNRINAQLEAMAKTLYDYWFVQFDFPDKNGKSYRSSGGKMVYNKKLKREIPEGWEGKIIANIATVKAGGDKPEIFSEEKTEIFSIPIFANGTIDEGLYGYTNKATVDAPSITISARGSIGYTVLRNKPFVPIIRLIVITPKNPIYTYFIYEYIKSIGFGKSGSVQQQLTSPMVSNMKIVYPSESLIKKFYRLTSGYTAMIQAIKEQNQQLAELRDWLLPMLMNGQAKICD
ncbi:MAG: restriction endonuclease subunit S [Phycisphaerae bacterium]|nr:restriction endonuclease subunit S [Phycisphaerae bacterium]